MATTATRPEDRGSGSLPWTQRGREAVDLIRSRLSLRRLRAAQFRLQRAIGITRNGQLAVAGAVVLWLTARIVAGEVIYLAAYGVVLLLGMCYALAPRGMRMTGERAGLFPRAQEGQRLEVDLALTAARRVSTFVLEERVPDRLGRTVSLPVASLAANERVTHHYSVVCSRRGVYRIGPLVAVAGDPFGLSQRETLVAEPFELLVHPRVELVSDRPLTRQFEDPPIRPPVSKPWPSGLEFYGMRPYVPGDDLRRIVWRATARTGTVMVREAEQGITDRITLLLDTDRGAHSHIDDDTSESFETGVRIVASLGVRHLREGYEVRAETGAGPLVRPLRGNASQLGLLDELARLDMGRAPLARAIDRLVADPRRDAHLIVVTPRLQASDAARLQLLIKTGVSILVVALVWDEHTSTVAANAAALGCQVVSIRPGQDISAALAHGIGAGTR